MSDQCQAAVPLPAGRVAQAVRGAQVALLGYGISNRSLLPILLALGATVSVYDKKAPSELGGEALTAQDAGVRFYTDMDDMALDSMRIVFRSPSLHPDIPAIARAKAAGVEISSESAWFLEETPATVLAVTGSDGKSTTSTLTAKILEADGKRVYLGGNIGTPLLPLVGGMTENDFAVLEMSSFQLYDLPAHISPHRAAITNLSPNHLDWHSDMQDYMRAKCRILGERTHRLVTNAQNAPCAAIAKEQLTRREVVVFSSAPCCAQTDTVFLSKDNVIVLRTSDGRDEPLLCRDGLLLPGRHNAENLMCAIGLCHDLVSRDAIRCVASAFGGVKHRLERVRVRRGVTYYNSSIDSSPTRTAAALSALPMPIVAICGGYDKKIPFAPLAKTLCERARAVVLTGATAQKIHDALLTCPAFSSSRLIVRRADTFEEAVHTAAALANEGDAVLLSPACASFDAFRDFEERGNTFKRIVLELPD